MHDDCLFILPNEEEQVLLGKKLARSCYDKSTVIYLQGDLGVGKTTIARGFINSLGFKGKIKSPTYGLIESYELENIKILHIDLYRINHPEEVYGLGLRDALGENVIYLIEWPEKALTELPPPDITCNMSAFENGRKCHIIAHTERGREMVKTLCQNV